MTNFPEHTVEGVCEWVVGHTEVLAQVRNWRDSAIETLQRCGFLYAGAAPAEGFTVMSHGSFAHAEGHLFDPVSRDSLTIRSTLFLYGGASRLGKLEALMEVERPRASDSMSSRPKQTLFVFDLFREGEMLDAERVAAQEFTALRQTLLQHIRSVASRQLPDLASPMSGFKARLEHELCP